MINNFYSLWAVLLFVSVPAEGLRCYTCSYDEKDAIENYKCVTEPWNLTGNPIRACLSHINYCIIVRVEMRETGRVSSFLRKCEEKPMEDSDVDSISVVAHYRSCMTDLCNKGDGLNFVDEGFEGDSVALLVPDKNLSNILTYDRILRFATFLCMLWRSTF